MKPRINDPHEIRDYFNTRGRYQAGTAPPVRPPAGTTKALVFINFPVISHTFSIEPNTAGPVELLPRYEAKADVFPPTATAGPGSYSLSGADSANYSIAANGQITYNGPAKASGSDNFTIHYNTAETDDAYAGIEGTYQATVNFAQTQTPDFAKEIYTFSMPSDLDGSTIPASFNARVDAANAHSYSLSVPTAGFTIDRNSGEIYYVGRPASIIAGDSFTLEITATNTAGTDSCQVLITAKGRVSITFDPAEPDWYIPAGQAGPIVLGQIKVSATSDDTRAAIPVPSLTPNAGDFALISTMAISHNTFRVDYNGPARQVGDRALLFNLVARTAENGTALPAIATNPNIQVPILPAQPEFSDPSYVFELLDESDPQPSIVVGLPTATHLPGQSQRWRIITPQTGTRRFAINSATGEITYIGPDIADRATTASYSLRVGCRNIQGGVASREAVQVMTINVKAIYAPPVFNANWNPADGGAPWVKGPDGSWSAQLDSGWQPLVISVGPTGPWTIQEGLTATYRHEFIPNVVRQQLAFRLDFSRESEGVYRVRNRAAVEKRSGSFRLYMSDGTTEESLTFHVVSTTSTATVSHATWYEDGPGLTYKVIDDKGITINFPEGQTSPVSRNIYATFTEIASRINSSLTEPTQAGFDIVPDTRKRRQITIDGEQVWIDAWQINIDPTMFDYETQSVYDLQAILSVPEITLSATTYGAVHKPLDIHLRVADVAEPPKRTAQAAPANFELKRRGPTENLSLAGYWVSEDDPDRNNLAYRLVVSVLGATGNQPTTSTSYLSAALIGDTFQAEAGAGAVLFSTPRRIKFDIYCREASTGIENSVPLTFYCDAVHDRAQEDSPLTWAATVPSRLEFSVAENIALPHLLRNDIYAESTVSDMSAEAGPISYSLREPTFWIVRNTSFQWNGTISLDAGESQTFNMADAFRIEGPDAARKLWALSATSDDNAVATVSVNGPLATVTAADLETADNTNFYFLGTDGNFVAVYTGYISVTIPTTPGDPVLPAGYTNIGLVGGRLWASSVGSNVVKAFNRVTGRAETASDITAPNIDIHTQSYTAQPASVTPDVDGLWVWTNFLDTNSVRRLLGVPYTPAGSPTGEFGQAGIEIDGLTSFQFCWDAAGLATDRTKYVVKNTSPELPLQLVRITFGTRTVSGTTVPITTISTDGTTTTTNFFIAGNLTPLQIIVALETELRRLEALPNIRAALWQSGTWITSYTATTAVSTSYSVSAGEPTAVCCDGTTLWQSYKGINNWILHAKSHATGADTATKHVNVPTSKVALTEHIRCLEIVGTDIWIVKQASKTWNPTTTQTIVKVSKP